MVLEDTVDVGVGDFKIAHISDIHFGRIAHPAIVHALVQDINDADVDLVVVSGDLTQRAFPHQYRAAAALLSAFNAPYLTIPGNHDVFPWWRTFSRLFDPLRRYRKWITDDMSPAIRVPGLAVLGINSAFGRTIKGGRIDAIQQDAMRSFFDQVAGSEFRILAVHHHLTELSGLRDCDVALGAASTLEIARQMGVKLILCGHLHVSHVEKVDVGGSQSIVIACAGTATSSRGRKPHKKANYYNRIHISRTEFAVEERKYDSHSLNFAEARVSRFPR